MMQRRGSAKKLHEARVAWLTPRLHLHPVAPGIHEDVTDDGRAALGVLHAEMKAAGLFGSSTAITQREAVRRLVSELRGVSIGVPW